MTTDEARREAVRLFMDKSDEAFQAARQVLTASLAAAVNRAYYACFYAASAVLIAESRKFVKHAGLQAAVHKHLVHPGRLSKDLGKAYDRLALARYQADYEAEVTWTLQKAADAIEAAERIVAALRALLPLGS